MNILTVSNLYPPNAVGGYERLCCDAVRALSAKGHDLHVLTSTYGDGVPDFPDHHVIRGLRLLADEQDIYRPFSPPPGEQARIERHNADVLRQTLQQTRPDLLFVWNLFFLDASLLQAVLAAPCPKAFLLTDNWMACFLRPEFWGEFSREEITCPPSFANRCASLLTGVASRFRRPRFSLPGVAIFPSAFMRDFYVRAGFSFTRTRVVPHGVHLPDRSTDVYVPRDRTVAPDRLRLLFAGRVVEFKGAHTVLEALPHLVARLPGTDIRLTILGDARDTGYLERLRRIIQENNLDRHVAFLPPVAEADLFAVFQDHDIYLFPSLYEPFALTLIHALESGIPTVASNAGGNPEIVLHGRTGLVFPKGDAMALARSVLTLHRDPALRANLSRQARRVAREYTFSRMMQQVGQCLEETACASP